VAEAAFFHASEPRRPSESFDRIEWFASDLGRGGDRLSEAG
jgi:hypothetical protein